MQNGEISRIVGFLDEDSAESKGRRINRTPFQTEHAVRPKRRRFVVTTQQRRPSNVVVLIVVVVIAKMHNGAGITLPISAFDAERRRIIAFAGRRRMRAPRHEFKPFGRRKLNAPPGWGVGISAPAFGIVAWRSGRDGRRGSGGGSGRGGAVFGFRGQRVTR